MEREKSEDLFWKNENYFSGNRGNESSRVMRKKCLRNQRMRMEGKY